MKELIHTFAFGKRTFDIPDTQIYNQFLPSEGLRDLINREREEYYHVSHLCSAYKTPNQGSGKLYRFEQFRGKDKGKVVEVRESELNNQIHPRTTLDKMIKGQMEKSYSWRLI